MEETKEERIKRFNEYLAKRREEYIKNLPKRHGQQICFDCGKRSCTCNK